MKKACAVLLILILSVLATASNAEVRFTVTDLGTLAGDKISVGYDVNNQGQVVGYSWNDLMRPVSWNTSGLINPLGFLSGTNTGCAYSLNESGQIVGENGKHAVIWDNAVPRYLASLPGDTEGCAYSINNSGVAVGYSLLPAIRDTAVRWDNGWVTSLAFAAETDSRAYDINDAGQIVGYSKGAVSKAVRWDADGSTVVLEPLPGDMNWNEAYGINIHGRAVGRSGYYGVMWDANGKATTLGSLYNSWSYARDINNYDLIVGRSAERAVLWDGTLWDLNNLIPQGSGWILEDAISINDNGWIVGCGVYNGQTHAFLLTPVPEPSNLLTLLCGLGGTGGLALCKKKYIRS